MRTLSNLTAGVSKSLCSASQSIIDKVGKFFSGTFRHHVVAYEESDVVAYKEPEPQIKNLLKTEIDLVNKNWVKEILINL